MDTLSADVLDSPAVSLLLDLERDGFQISLTTDGSLSISPRSRLTTERMQAIAEARDTLRLLVRFCDPDVQDRRRVFRAQVATGGPFSYRAVPYGPGTCHSCGDALPRLAFGSCWRCMLARRLACWAPIPADLLSAWDEGKLV